MVRLGIIGPGATWEGLYLPALQNLRRRVCVQSVYDAVFARAHQVARSLGVTAATSLLRLARRRDVDALLLLDSFWYGAEVLRLLCAEGKPVYIAADVGNDPAVLQALHWTAVNFGLTLMPEFPLRYIPATARLHELMATCLGQPYQLRGNRTSEISPEKGWSLQDEDTVHWLVNWFDWARYVIRSVPRHISVLTMRPSQISSIAPASITQSELPAETETRSKSKSDAASIITAETPQCVSPQSAAEKFLQVTVQFKPLRNGLVPTAQLHWAQTNSVVRSERAAKTERHPGRQEVVCTNGMAVIESPTLLRWRTEGEWTEEQLSADRNETEVQIDHFCRRVVGGLIPVADLSDVSKGLALASAAHQSWQSGVPVPLNGHL